MPRMRMIKPEIWQDEKLVSLPPVTRLLFVSLISLADDAGRLLDKPVKIEADVFDGIEDYGQQVREALATLARVGVIQRGLTASGQRVIQVTNWKKHQRIDHPNLKAAFPQIVTLLDDTGMEKVSENDSRAIREPFAEPFLESFARDSENDSREIPRISREPLAHRAASSEQLSVTSDQRPTTIDPRAASSEPREETDSAPERPELVQANSNRHSELLAAAANRGVAERHGNSAKPITASSGAKLTQALAAAAVPLAFALDRVQSKAQQLASPPRALSYFTEFVLEQWQEELALSDAEHFTPSVWPGQQTRSRGRGGSAEERAVADRRVLVDYAERGDEHAIAECERLGIQFARAIA